MADRPSDPDPGITFSVDIEDHRPEPSWPFRLPELVDHLLGWCEERSITMTAFVVGSLADAHPELIERLAAAGHEIAHHNWRHEPLTALDESTFRQWARRGRAVLEDTAQQQVVGFRAPTGSLVPATVWCTDVLAEEGYLYSSSALPARSPLYGFPGAPRVAYRWPCGLIETGVHTMGVGSLRVPLGGTYLRLLPWRVTTALSSLSPPPPRSGLYFHPYDFDVDEPFWRVPDAGRLSRLLWVGRAGLLDKLDAVAARWGAAPPYRERFSDATDLPVFDPVH